MDTRARAQDPTLERLQANYPGHRIWRSRRWDGGPGDWVATLWDRAAGVDPTVIRSDPGDLAEELEREAERAAARGHRLR